MGDFSMADPKWADVERVPQDDGPNPAAPINYSQQFKQVMDLFRAVLLLDEHSERTLELSTAVIEMNAANYTAWHFRRKVLKSLGSDLYKELEFTREHALDSPKNYQIWHHRREIVDRLNDSAGELESIAESLEDDNKNYHAWSYRQWVVKRFSLWGEELAFVDKMLDLDIRNNSAWNHRWYIVHHMAPITPEIREREIDYAIAFIRKAPHNESPWNYLQGWLKTATTLETAKILDVAKEIYDANSGCIFAASVLVDIHAAEGSDLSIEHAKKILQDLILVDPIRAAYWSYRISQLPGGSA